MITICELWLDITRFVVWCHKSPWSSQIREWPSSDSTASTQICATIVLAIVAFVAPYVVWRLQRRYLAPSLNPDYEHKEPLARLSSRSLGGQPTGIKVYDFHFRVVNGGKTPARNVVAEIVEFWFDKDGALARLEGFLPVYLRYHQTEYVDIHPERPYYWNIGEIPSRDIQNSWNKQALCDVPGKRGPGLRFKLDLLNAPHNQPNVLLKGTYGLKVVLYSENARPATICLRVEWSGRWRASAQAMLKQIVITRVDSFS